MIKNLVPYERKYLGEYDYLICSVRKASEGEKKTLERYVGILRNKGEQVLYPAEDTVQEDSTGGCRICRDHTMEIAEASKIRVVWNPLSTGSYVDLGTAFHEHFINKKPILLANRKYVEKIVEEQKEEGMDKSYEMTLLRIDKDSRNSSPKL